MILAIDIIATLLAFLALIWSIAYVKYKKYELELRKNKIMELQGLSADDKQPVDLCALKMQDEHKSTLQNRKIECILGVYLCTVLK